MKNQTTYILAGVLIVIIGVLVFIYGRPKAPVVGEDGKISGTYSIDSIMSLEKPYVCTFEKADETSKVSGIIHTDGENIFGEFRIRTDLLEKEFNSFLLVKDDVAYNWTSLFPLGYKSPAAKSAIKNASPEEQAQIIGTRDKVEYKCKPWPEVDKSAFEPPSWITFTELKN